MQIHPAGYKFKMAFRTNEFNLDLYRQIDICLRMRNDSMLILLNVVSSQIIKDDDWL